jgi:hypothetical protein
MRIHADPDPKHWKETIHADPDTDPDPKHWKETIFELFHLCSGGACPSPFFQLLDKKLPLMQFSGKAIQPIAKLTQHVHLPYLRNLCKFQI